MTRQAHVPDADHAKKPDHKGDAGSRVPLSLTELSAVLLALSSQVSGCRLAAFGDLNARLVLRAEPAGVWPQEALDDLCAQACEAFEIAQIAAEAPFGDPIIALVPGETRLFVKISADPACDSGEALLVVCDSLSAARHIERQLSTELRGFLHGSLTVEDRPCLR